MASQANTFDSVPWKRTPGHSGTEFGDHPIILVNIQSGHSNSPPAMSLNRDLVEKFRRRPPLYTLWRKLKGVYRPAKASSSIQSTQPVSRLYALRTTSKRHGGRFTNGQREERRSRSERSCVATKPTIRLWRRRIKFKKMLEKLETEVRKEEKAYFDHLKEIRDLCFGAFVEAEVIEPTDGAPKPTTPPNSIPSSSKLQVPGCPRKPRQHARVDSAIPVVQEAPETNQPELQEEEKDTKGEEMDALVKEAKELKRREKNVSGVERKLNRHQTSFTLQIEEYAAENDCDKEEVASEFGPMFIKLGREIFRAPKQAEKARDEAKKTAIDAGVPEDEDEDSDDDSEDDDADELEHNSMKRKPYDDDYDPSHVLQWLEDPERPAKHKRRIRPNHYEMPQMFEYVPISPSDSGSVKERSPRRRALLEAHKKQCDEDRKNLDELMPDALPDTENYGIFDFPRLRIRTGWEKRWHSRQRILGVRSRKRRSSI
jgi:hypothetical protein